MITSLPDRHFVRQPRFERADRYRLRWHQRNIASTRGASVLRDGEWMKINHPRREFPVFSWRWRVVFVFTFSSRWIIEGPMLHIALPALHHGATHSVIPTLAISRRVAFGKM